MSNLDCLIIGAGGHAKVVIEAIRSREWHVLRVLDEDSAKEGSEFCGYQVGSLSTDHNLDVRCHIAIGSGEARRRLATKMRQRVFLTIQHIRAYVSETAKLGFGCFIGVGAVVQSDTEIDSHTIINSGAIIEHDCQIGEFCHIAPGAILGGGVSVGCSTFIGMGARILPGLAVGNNCVVGAGAVVTSSIPDGETVIGIPARTSKISRQ